MDRKKLTKEEQEKLDIFLEYLNKNYREVSEEDIDYYRDEFFYGNKRYLILTYEEADEFARETALDNLENDLCYIPKHLQEYFDRDYYLEDSITYDSISETWEEFNDYIIFLL